MHIKKAVVVATVRKMQNKTTMSYHLTHDDDIYPKDWKQSMLAEL